MVGWVVASTPLGLRLKGEWAMVEGNPVAALVRFAEHYGSIIPRTGREVFFLREGLPHRGTVSTGQQHQTPVLQLRSKISTFLLMEGADGSRALSVQLPRYSSSPRIIFLNTTMRRIVRRGHRRWCRATALIAVPVSFQESPTPQLKDIELDERIRHWWSKRLCRQ